VSRMTGYERMNVRGIQMFRECEHIVVSRMIGYKRMNVRGKFTKYKTRSFFATFLKLWLSAR